MADKDPATDPANDTAAAANDPTNDATVDAAAHDGAAADAGDAGARAAALQKVTAGALAAVTHGGRVTREGWRQFRARSQYFQYRVALVVAWIVVSGLTLALAPPTPKDFVVQRRDLSFGLANRTALLIVNQNSGNLDGCVLEVTGVDVDFDGRNVGAGTWRTKPFSFRKGDRKTISTEEFFDDQNHSPGYQLEITRARLLHDDDVLWSGTPARPDAAPGAGGATP